MIFPATLEAASKVAESAALRSNRSAMVLNQGLGEVMDSVLEAERDSAGAVAPGHCVSIAAPVGQPGQPDLGNGHAQREPGR